MSHKIKFDYYFYDDLFKNMMILFRFKRNGFDNYRVFHSKVSDINYSICLLTR